MNLSLNNDKDSEMSDKVVFEGAGASPYIFEKYGDDQIIFVDDSNTIKIFYYDSYNRTVSVHK